MALTLEYGIDTPTQSPAPTASVWDESTLTQIITTVLDAQGYAFWRSRALGLRLWWGRQQAALGYGELAIPEALCKHPRNVPVLLSPDGSMWQRMPFRQTVGWPRHA